MSQRTDQHRGPTRTHESMRFVAVVLAIVSFAGPASAQQIIRPERVSVLVSRERIARDAERVRTSIARIGDRAATPAARVRAARERAEVETALGNDVRTGASVHVEVEPGARAEWERISGTPFRGIDGTRRYRECLELARTEHVVSDDARECARRASEWGTRHVGELPSPLYVPGVPASLSEDRRGSRSTAAHARLERALAARPTDRDARLALAGIEIVALDHERALRTLAPLASDYEVELARALATWGRGQQDRATAMLEALVRANVDRGEAAFDLAQLLLGVHPSEYQRPSSLSTTQRALAAHRVHLCAPASAIPAPSDARAFSERWADLLQAMIERPANWSGPGALRPPVEGMPVVQRDGVPPDPPPLMRCARARARMIELLDPPRALPARATAPALRPLAPLTSTVVGPRPSFAWIGPSDAVIELCDDRACASVRETMQPRSNPHRPTRALSEGRYFWRVRSGSTVSATRVLFVAAHARGEQRIPDVDCDGWPDLPLESSGWLAHFTSDGVPHLIPLTNDETATAHAFFAGDLDGDGCGDVVQITGFGLQALYGSPAGLEPPRALPASDCWWATPAGDLDRDGLEDLVLDTNGGIDVWSAARREPAAFGGGPIEAVGDVDGDGIADLASREFNSLDQRGSFGLVRGGADGLATSPVTPLPITRDNQRIFALGDVNGDSRADVALFRSTTDDYDGPGELELHRGTRRGLDARAFGARARVSDRDVVVRAVGDVDADGFDDVIVLDGTSVALLRGSRTGLRAPATLRAWPARASMQAARIPSGAVLWLFAPLFTSATRVEQGRATEVQLTPP